MNLRRRSSRGLPASTSSSTVASAVLISAPLHSADPTVIARDHLVLIGLARLEVARLLAEPQHVDAVRHLEDVREVVADHHHAVPALAQPLDQLEHLRGLAHAERGGGLVEHHELRLTQQRASDGDLLALPARHRADLGPHAGDRHRQVLEQLAGLLLHVDLVELADESGRALGFLLAPEEEVLDHVEVVAQREVLVDGRDAEVNGVTRAVDRDLACPRS